VSIRVVDKVLRDDLYEMCKRIPQSTRVISTIRPTTLPYRLIGDVPAGIEHVFPNGVSAYY
jgi:hypothetical protein